VRPTTDARSLNHRDLVNEVYDRGCDLVEAAMAIRRVAAADIGRAVPALLGCVESALDELASASARLGTPLESYTQRPPEASAGLDELSDALIDARDRASAAREAVSRAAAKGADH
jgi:hypothetical protein